MKVRAAVSIVALFAALPATAAKTEAGLPAWLAGGWATQSDNGGWSEEWWTPPRGGVMLGAGRSGKGDKIEWWEQTRIEQAAGKISFCALPKGQVGACFTATKVSADEIVFENPEHDFPTRVAYRRTGEGVTAEISGPNGANRQTWQFKRVP
jgi:hypothetical protein